MRSLLSFPKEMIMACGIMSSVCNGLLLLWQYSQTTWNMADKVIIDQQMLTTELPYFLPGLK